MPGLGADEMSLWGSSFKFPTLKLLTSEVPTAPGQGRHNPLRGMAVMVAAMMLIPVMDGSAKYLMNTLPPLQVVWARYFFHFVLFLPFVFWRYGWATFWINRPGLQMLRSTALLFSTCCFFFAIQQMPLADTLAVLFVYPFVVTGLSFWLLGERVGIYRWGAVSVGFLGALVVIRPGFETVSNGTLLAIGAGIGYAAYVLFTRRLRGSDPVLVTLLWTALVGTIAMSFVQPLVWVMPTVGEYGLMALIGVLAAGVHYMIILAYEYATAPQLAPIGYVEIVSATTVGYLAFGDFPDALTWLGIAIIIASGIYIAWREAKRNVLK